MRLYLGNLPFSATEIQIKEFLAPYKTTEVRMILDRETGRPRGFAFAQMETAAAAEEAIENRNGYEMGGRRIVVNAASERVRGAPPTPNKTHKAYDQIPDRRPRAPRDARSFWDREGDE